MINIVTINDKKYIFTGCIISKKDIINLAYNIETRQIEYFICKTSLLGKKQYVRVNEKLGKILDGIFNLVEDDLLYAQGENNDASSQIKTLEDFDVSKYNFQNIDDEKYKDVFKESLKYALKNIKDFFPECNSKNLDLRVPSLKLEVVDDDNYNACFSRWKNIIYISRKTFKNPKLLNNVICHEIFHLMGTETEITKGGMIKKSTSRRTGFESRFSYGKGINEGFIQKYANIMSYDIGLLSFEVRVADMLEIIFADDLAKENSNSDISYFNTLSKDKNSLIHFVKLVDCYHMFKNRYIDNKKIDKKYHTSYNFITEIEKCLIEFFFNKVKELIKENQYGSRDEIITHIKMFKNKLVFKENLTSELAISLDEVIDEFDDVKDLFVTKVKEIEEDIKKHIVKKRHEKEFKLINEIKKISKFTFNITDVLEILDYSFRKSFNLNDKEKVYLLAQKMDSKRKFYIIVLDENNNAKEILNNDIEIIRELKDATVYDNLNVLDEAREKERRHTSDRTFSIYRKVDGTFGIADLVDKQNRILRALKTLTISIPFFLIDDSLEDFSYLNDFVRPDVKI